jgi:hypothetical protein
MPSDAASITALLQTQGPCTAPLDAAAEYLRRRADRVLPLYVIAMLPHAIIVAALIGAIVGQRRSDVARDCLYLVPATVWRWTWLAYLQGRIQQDLQAHRVAAFHRRILPILLCRLYSNAAVTWGSLLVGIPAFYGWFLGSFAAPLLLENADPTPLRIKDALSWIRHSGKRLFRILWAMTVIAVLLLVAIVIGQTILAQTLLPNLLGIDTADLNVTLGSWAWRLGILYFVLLLLDLFWTVASVLIYYDSQSRRTATDLRTRLAAVTREP